MIRPSRHESGERTHSTINNNEPSGHLPLARDIISGCQTLSLPTLPTLPNESFDTKSLGAFKYKISMIEDFWLTKNTIECTNISLIQGRWVLEEWEKPGLEQKLK